jgi:predicted metal-binding membrane protein
MSEDAVGRQADSASAALPRRDRVAILSALAGIAAICWYYAWAQAVAMGGMADLAMPARFAPWTAADFGLNLLLWWVMMLGMMLPSAAPMILFFATINRKKRGRGEPYVPTALFAAGYAVAWGLFGTAATAAEWGLEQAALISPLTQQVGPRLGGAVLVLAGLYQLTPLKSACLAKCRSPLGFVLTRWRDGPGGALAMGAEHGLWCLGCCWALMALLFAGGVMSLLWMAALAVFVLIEKAAPGGHRVGQGGGLLLLVCGVWLLLLV